MRIELSKPIGLGDLCAAVGVRVPRRAKAVTAITTDSRMARAGDLFIALGEGTRYIHDARIRGATTVGESAAADLRCRGESALLAAAAHYRRNALPRLCEVVGITGSVGKTTTKEFLTRLLLPHRRVHATVGNRNNQIGLPLTILSAGPDTETLVLEMGMNSQGEIAALSRAAAPTVGLITNIGTAHVGRLGSREAIALAKLELAAGLSGRLHGPFGEPLIDGRCDVLFTVGEKADTAGREICAVGDKQDTAGRELLSLSYSDGRVGVFKNGRFIGGGDFISGARHHLVCLAAALSVATELVGDRAVEQIAAIGRDAVRERYIEIGELTVVDDSYNASLESVRASLDSLTDSGIPTRSALLGDILELGAFSSDIHAEVGRLAAERLNGEMWLIGEFAVDIARGAVLGGFPVSKIHLMHSREECADAISARCGREIVLVKGSHACELWRIGEMIKERRCEG